MSIFYFIKKINRFLAIISGAIILFIGILCTFEAITRGLDRPITWGLDISRYLLIWAIFLSSAYAFQTKTHVSVDFIRESVKRTLGLNVSRVLTILSYFLALVYVLTLFWNSIDLLKDALYLHKLTLGNVQIPIAFLYLAMLIGSFLMIVTLIYIIMVILKENRYL